MFEDEYALSKQAQPEVDEYALPATYKPEQQEVDEYKLPAARQTEEVFNQQAAVSTFEAEMGGVDPTAIQETPYELPEKEVPKTMFKELTRDDNLQVIKDYAVTRFGESGKQEEGESNEDYVKRWMRSMRQVEWNTELNGVPELNWIYNSKKEDVLKAARAHKLYESVPDFYEEGGQSAGEALFDITASIASSPSTAISFGIGALGRYKAARESINQAIKYRIKAVTAAAATEAAMGAGASAVDQQRELELDRTQQLDTLDKQNQMVTDALQNRTIDQAKHDVLKNYIETQKIEQEQRTIDMTQVALAAGISSLFGAAEAGSVLAKAPKVSTKEDLEKILSTRVKTPTDVETKKFVDTFDAEMEKTLTEFDVFEGRKTLDELSPETPLTQAEIRKDINTRALNVARYILLTDPSYSQVKQRVAAKEQKVSDAVKNVFMDIDAIDEDILDAALNKAGLTFSEFGQAARTTVADAASIMQGYSTLAKVLKRAVQLDPQAELLAAKMYGDQDVVSAMGYLGNGIKRLERESKALVVSSIGTTVRNAYGTVTGMTYESASRLLEGTLYTMGKVAKGAATGTYQKGDLTNGLRETVRDSFNNLVYLTNAGLTAEIVDRVLIHNPKLQHTLFHALQETGTENLSRVARAANTFNVAQDVFFRRAIFTASIERQLRRIGMDMYQIMRDGKNIPADVLKNASDDALKGTFSYMPKPKKAGQITMEAQAEGLANQFVRFFENLPGGSLAVTFPRFMTNAMAFQYRYSPLGAGSGVQDMLAAAAKFKSDPDAATRLYREGLGKFSKGAVGTAAIYAAYKYRLDNQDSEWFNVQNEDGSTVDTRAVFPIGPYLAVGDFLAKLKLGRTADANVTEMLEAIAGMKMPAGAQSSFLNSLPEIVAAEEGKEAERFEKGIGKILGDFAGRFIQPGQPVFAFLDQFDEESQIARDPNVITSDDIVEEAALNRVKVKIPGVKEELPEALKYFREGPTVRAGEFFNLITGVRVVPSGNKIEREFTSLNIEPYTFYVSSGDKTYDRAVVESSRPYVERFVGKMIDSDRYQDMTLNQQKIAMTNNMRQALNLGREITQAKMMVADRARINKMTFNKLAQQQRLAINELYAYNNDGRTMDQDKAYDQVYRYQALLETLR